MFSIHSRDTGYDGHDIEFRAVDSGGETVGSAYAAIDGDALRLDIIQTNPPKRGIGIGKAMIAAVIAWGRDREPLKFLVSFVLTRLLRTWRLFMPSTGLELTRKEIWTGIFDKSVIY